MADCWLLPIPRFDLANGVHKKLAAMAQEAQKLVAGFPVHTEVHFPATRRPIREVAEGSAIGNEVNDIVYELLS